MQNKYVGDESDFAKYYLLINLYRNDFILGINWCMVEDEDNNDGKRISYLKNNKFHSIDGNLIQKINAIIDNDCRNIGSIQQSEIFHSNTLYFSEIIPFETERFLWHESSLKYLETCDIIFYDPDNGLEVKSIGKLHPNAKKYIYYDEIREAFRKGKSLVIYQHSNRSANSEIQIETRIQQLINCLSISKKEIRVVHSQMGSGRYFIIIKQNNHSVQLDANLNQMDRTFLKIY